VSAFPDVADDLAPLAYAAGRGDRDALTELIRRTPGDIVRFLASPSSPSEAEDLAQETYLRGSRVARAREDLVTAMQDWPGPEQTAGMRTA
jgi:DNA-directed RNA polymerase specialized sigma24 family protein